MPEAAPHSRVNTAQQQAALKLAANERLWQLIPQSSRPEEGSASIWAELLAAGKQHDVAQLVAHLPDLALKDGCLNGAMVQNILRGMDFDGAMVTRAISATEPGALLSRVALIGKAFPESAAHLWKQEADALGIVRMEKKAGKPDRLVLAFTPEQFVEVCAANGFDPMAKLPGDYAGAYAAAKTKYASGGTNVHSH